MPALTIGMPLYNNSRTLSRAVESIRQQAFEDFVCVMSDDGSSDETVSIANEIVQSDHRFTLVQQPRNLNYGNFRYLLSCAKTEFFMFAAGDDRWHPTYVSRCIEALVADPSAVLAVTQVRFDGLDDRGDFALGTRSLTGTVSENLVTYLRAPMDNSRMYGVLRTSCAVSAFPMSDHFAFDWTFSAATLRGGTHLEIPEQLLFREKTPSSRYVEYIRRDARTFVDLLLPLRGMTSSLVREKHIPLNGAVVRALTAANLRAHLVYASRFWPRYDRLVGPLLRRVLWRL